MYLFVLCFCVIGFVYVLFTFIILLLLGCLRVYLLL